MLSFHCLVHVSRRPSLSAPSEIRFDPRWVVTWCFWGSGNIQPNPQSKILVLSGLVLAASLFIQGQMRHQAVNREDIRTYLQAVGRMPKPNLSFPTRSRAPFHVARYAREELEGVSPNGQPWTKITRRRNRFLYFRVIFTRAPFNAGGKSEKKLQRRVSIEGGPRDKHFASVGLPSPD